MLSPSYLVTSSPYEFRFGKRKLRDLSRKLPTEKWQSWWDELVSLVNWFRVMCNGPSPSSLPHSFPAASVHVWGHLEDVPAWWWWNLIWKAKGITGWSNYRPGLPGGWLCTASPAEEHIGPAPRPRGRPGANHTGRATSPLILQHGPCG